MSRSTSEAFADVIEWVAEQPWSSGKVGLLGISYYAGSQWRVAARRPKGLTCIVPWEGMSDYYRDRCRHGGILSHKFIDFWWNRQVVNNQYGLAGRAARKWGNDTIEGDLLEDQLKRSRNDQTIDNVANRFLDDDYYASRDYNMEDIQVPLLSVGNWGGIGLHLRGNVEGFINAGSKLKYLRFVTGRHDLPFYSKSGVALQLSFLNAFLKGDDNEGWSTGAAPKVGLVLRKGDVGYNDPVAESVFQHRHEEDWPIPRTSYVKYHLNSNGSMSAEAEVDNEEKIMSYPALGTLEHPQSVSFTSAPFKEDCEFTGHVVAHVNVSASRDANDHEIGSMDMDIFATLRYISPAGKEVMYTGTVGDPVPLCKGWLRVSLRKTNSDSPRHTFWHPHREYLSKDEELLQPGQVYEVDVELWPTNVTVEKGGRLIFEVSSGDTQGAGIFEHHSSEDRSVERFGGMNHLHFGGGRENWVLMPEIPAA